MPGRTQLSAEAIRHIASGEIGVRAAKSRYGVGEPRVRRIRQGLEEARDDPREPDTRGAAATLLEAPAPKHKDTTKAIDLPPGEYICRRYASTNFRGAPRTILFLVGQNGEPDIETPTHGHFLEKEVESLGGMGALRKARAPLHCYLGAERTTPQKKKDRLAALAST